MEAKLERRRVDKKVHRRCKVEDLTTLKEKNLMKQVSQLSTSTAADIYVPKTNRHEEELVVLVVVIVVVVLLTTFYSRLTTNIMIL